MSLCLIPSSPPADAALSFSDLLLGHLQNLSEKILHCSEDQRLEKIVFFLRIVCSRVEAVDDDTESVYFSWEAVSHQNIILIFSFITVIIICQIIFKLFKQKKIIVSVESSCIFV